MVYGGYSIDNFDVVARFGQICISAKQRLRKCIYFKSGVLRIKFQKIQKVVLIWLMRGSIVEGEGTDWHRVGDGKGGLNGVNERVTKLR